MFEFCQTVNLFFSHKVYILIKEKLKSAKQKVTLEQNSVPILVNLNFQGQRNFWILNMIPLESNSFWQVVLLFLRNAISC